MSSRPVRTSSLSAFACIFLVVALSALLPGGPAEPAPGGHPPSARTSAAADTSAATISSLWAKPLPRATDYVAKGIDCGPTGSDGDTITNLRKNRTDIPGEYHAVNVRAITDLKFPIAPRSRARWTQAQLAEIEPFEGVAVTMTGYLEDLRVEGAERTNCGMTDSADVDWHLWVTQLPQEPKSGAIVVETTPRIRRSHPHWTPASLQPWVRSNRSVRISGWLMLDPDHPDQVGLTRSTIWEIHPITKIEVRDAPGLWTDLDSLRLSG